MLIVDHKEVNRWDEFGRATTVENFLTRDDLMPILSGKHYDRRRWTVAKFGMLHVLISNTTLAWARQRLAEESRCRHAGQR